RVAKQSGTVIPFPDRSSLVADWSDYKAGPKDTPPEIAMEKSYNYKEDVQAMKILRQTM
ncbi:hypothetical protein Pmar_PMAR023132, partial [Perkinsus marinus ATCC 50983]